MAVTELVSALLLLSGRFIAVALLLFAPVLGNIFLLHLFLQRPGVEFALLAAVPYLHLAWVYRERFEGVLMP